MARTLFESDPFHRQANELLAKAVATERKAGDELTSSIDALELAASLTPSRMTC